METPTQINNHTDLAVCTFNCEGLKRSNEYTKDILIKNDIDVICLQETWIHSYDIDQLSTFDTNYFGTGVSGMDSNKITNGRPFGGTAILYKKSLAKYVQYINVSDSRRSCAISIDMDKKYLIVCVYMPCDKGSNTGNTEYEDILFDIGCVIEKTQYDHIIICGDFNTSFERTNGQTLALTCFLRTHNLISTWDHVKSKKDYTYINISLNHKSCIDHFCVSANIFAGVTDNYILYDHDNISSHNPVMLRVSVANSGFKSVNGTDDENDSHRSININWSRTTNKDICNYRNELDTLLCSLDSNISALKCQDVLCNLSCHKLALNDICKTLVDACISASDNSIRKCNDNKCNRKPLLSGWNEQLAPLKEQSLFWHWVWLECGKPLTGPVSDCMKHTRRKYHYAIRNVKRKQAEIRKDNILKSYADKENKTEFWKKINTMIKTPGVTPLDIDGISGPGNISDYLAEKYESLYTSVPTDKYDLECLNEALYKQCMAHDKATPFSVSDITSSIHKLKHGKSSGSDSFMSDHILYASEKLHVWLTLIFNAMLVHGFTPSVLLHCNIIPIPKDKRGNLSDSNNYRGIALCNAMCKLLDIIIIDKFKTFLYTSDLQFAFKERHSTTLCTAVLLETVNYYTSRNSDVFCCLLDASKAFDKVNYGKLFQLLIARKLPAPVTRLLLDSYTRQEISIKWNGASSRRFNALNGVKQGGVLSPILFIVYFDTNYSPV